MSDKRYLFTSESVSMGHPDKLADQISDAVLDAMLAQDPSSRVACETLVTTGLAVIAGEITTNAVVNIPDIVREAVRKAGYDSGDKGFDYKSCGVSVVLGKQSADIAMGVDREGAGDQGHDVRVCLQRDSGIHAAADRHFTRIGEASSRGS